MVHSIYHWLPGFYLTPETDLNTSVVSYVITYILYRISLFSSTGFSTVVYHIKLQTASNNFSAFTSNSYQEKNSMLFIHESYCPSAFPSSVPPDEKIPPIIGIDVFSLNGIMYGTGIGCPMCSYDKNSILCL